VYVVLLSELLICMYLPERTRIVIRKRIDWYRSVSYLSLYNYSNIKIKDNNISQNYTLVILLAKYCSRKCCICQSAAPCV